MRRVVERTPHFTLVALLHIVVGAFPPVPDAHSRRPNAPPDASQRPPIPGCMAPFVQPEADLAAGCCPASPASPAILFSFFCGLFLPSASFMFLSPVHSWLAIQSGLARPRIPQPWGHRSNKDGRFLPLEHGKTGTDAPATPPTLPDICGLPKRTSYTVVAVLGIVEIAAAVGSRRPRLHGGQQQRLRPKTSPVCKDQPGRTKLARSAQQHQEPYSCTTPSASTASRLASTSATGQTALPWATQQLSLSILDGSPLALACIGNPITRNCLQACARAATYTHLVLFASLSPPSSRSRRETCFGGFADQTAKIQPLTLAPGRPSRTYRCLLVSTVLSGLGLSGPTRTRSKLSAPKIPKRDEQRSMDLGDGARILHAWPSPSPSPVPWTSPVRESSGISSGTRRDPTRPKVGAMTLSTRRMSKCLEHRGGDQLFQRHARVGDD
ncbi:hypothetical protein MAPG_06311 [Magnaporthiopsis poae ATCC 64411]|uniref:Uncharacterized protein n=1 Tax=Magnaporthiopsis poae (strain ATCC 64411 / 73-15) TaxID=644358 RepID=A0A0C4E1P4_MAGP6|nr:hypothetical protein MAPG_06311 [Magnaporthiopsis poae ATCC 64411]